MRQVIDRTVAERQASVERIPSPLTLTLGPATHVHAESEFVSVILKAQRPTETCALSKRTPGRDLEEEKGSGYFMVV